MKIIIPILGLIMFFACLPKKKKQKRDLFYFVVGLGHHVCLYVLESNGSSAAEGVAVFCGRSDPAGCGMSFFADLSYFSVSFYWDLSPCEKKPGSISGQKPSVCGCVDRNLQ